MLIWLSVMLQLLTVENVLVCIIMQRLTRRVSVIRMTNRRRGGHVDLRVAVIVIKRFRFLFFWKWKCIRMRQLMKFKPVHYSDDISAFRENQWRLQRGSNDITIWPKSNIAVGRLYPCSTINLQAHGSSNESCRNDKSHSVGKSR